MRLPAPLLVLLLALAGCSPPSYGRHRIVEFPSFLGTTVTLVETWDRPAGWLTGGELVSVDVLGHPSILSTIALPIALPLAAAQIDVDSSATANDGHGHKPPRRK